MAMCHGHGVWHRLEHGWMGGQAGPVDLLGGGYGQQRHKSTLLDVAMANGHTCIIDAPFVCTLTRLQRCWDSRWWR